MLTPHFTRLAITPILGRVLKQIQDWKQLYPYIKFPEQYPVRTNTVELSSVLPPSIMKKLQHWAYGKTFL
ncbi:two-component system, regulatory protein [Richelia intracellularis]|nr:two-component system, regulatory protein [Richelia intracellularis]